MLSDGILGIFATNQSRCQDKFASKSRIFCIYYLANIFMSHRSHGFLKAVELSTMSAKGWKYATTSAVTLRLVLSSVR